MRQIFLDPETTGLAPDNGDRIIEIGCVELLHRKLTGNNLHLYINPERDSHEDALRVHGITTEFLKDKPKFAEVVDQFLEYIEGAAVIIHNAPCSVRPELSTSKRSHKESSELRLPGNISLAITKVSMTPSM